jgi:hypothetical protein
MSAHQLTDMQVDAMFTALVKREGCQWIGYEVPRNERAKYCGEVAVVGKPYCQCHCDKAYQKGTALRGRRKVKAIERELAAIELKSEIYQQEAADIEV